MSSDSVSSSTIGFVKQPASANVTSANPRMRPQLAEYARVGQKTAEWFGLEPKPLGCMTRGAYRSEARLARSAGVPTLHRNRDALDGNAVRGPAVVQDRESAGASGPPHALADREWLGRAGARERARLQPV